MKSWLLQASIIFGFLALGEIIVAFTGINFSSSILGMLLLTLSLRIGIVKVKWVKGISDFLLDNLALFFVPAGVALMLYFDIIARNFWAIVLATIVSTVVVLISTGYIYKLFGKRK